MQGFNIRKKWSEATLADIKTSAHFYFSDCFEHIRKL